MASKPPSTAQREIAARVAREFKKIEDYTDEELAARIAVHAHNLPEAWNILNFVDCYFEQRRRRKAVEAAK